MVVRRGLTLLVLLLAVAFAPRGARAADASEIDLSVPTSCADLEGAALRLLAAPDHTPVAVEWMASPAAATAEPPLLPGEACLWMNGSLSDDCRLRDPASGPGPSSPLEFHSLRTAEPVDAPVLPLPDASRRPHVRVDAGQVHPGFAREMYRPPCA